MLRNGGKHMVRFFVDQDEFRAELLTLRGENAQHAKVLRLKQGEEVIVCDGQGNECICRISTDILFSIS